MVGAPFGMADVMAKLLRFSADITFHEIVLSFDWLISFGVNCLVSNTEYYHNRTALDKHYTIIRYTVIKTS
jgi:hypothetical protein